jgi:hypothetical protein
VATMIQALTADMGEVLTLTSVLRFSVVVNANGRIVRRLFAIDKDARRAGVLLDLDDNGWATLKAIIGNVDAEMAKASGSGSGNSPIPDRGKFDQRDRPSGGQVSGTTPRVGETVGETSGTSAGARQAQTVQQAPIAEQVQTRSCPDCREPILYDARVCRHCGLRYPYLQEPARSQVAIIAELHSQGRSAPEIIAELDGHGVRPVVGATWTTETIAAIIQDHVV